MRTHDIQPKTIKLAWDKKASDWRRNTTGKIEYVCQDRAPPHRLRYFSTDCDRVEDAQTFVKGLKADLLDHEIRDVEPTIAEIIDLYLKDRPQMRQGHSKVRAVLDAFGDRRFTSLTTRDIIEFKAERLAHVSEGTLRNELSVLKTVRKFACEVTPPMIPVEKVGALVKFKLPPMAKTTRDALSPDQIEQLWARFLTYDPWSAHRKDGGEAARLSRLARFGAIAIDTGARKRAIETLKWKQVDFVHKLIHFDEHLDQAIPFNKQRAKCPMSERLETLLLQAKTEARSDWVLDGPGTIERTLKASIKGTAFEGKLHAHLFRHSFITHMLLAGNPVALVGKIVADGPQTLARYTHVSTEYARDNLKWGARREAAVVDLEVERAKRMAAA